MRRIVDWEPVWRLPEPEHQQVLDWADQATGGCLVLTAEMLAEGRVRLHVPVSLPQGEWYRSGGVDGWDLLTRAVYTSDPLPPALLALLVDDRRANA